MILEMKPSEVPLHDFIYEVVLSLQCELHTLTESEEARAIMSILEVKHYHQPRKLYCVPTSMKMCLDYVFKTYKVKGCKVFSVRKIAKITETRDRDGTAPRAVENINRYLRKARPSLSFRYREGSKFTELDKEVNEKKLPAIVYLNQVELPHTVLHAVVVIGYDPNMHIVYFDDPAEDEENCVQKMEVGKFMRRWEWQTKWVQILLSEGQTYIDAHFQDKGVKK